MRFRGQRKKHGLGLIGSYAHSLHGLIDALHIWSGRG